MRSESSTTVTVSLPNGPALQLTVIPDCAFLRTSDHDDSPVAAYLLDRHQELHRHLPYSQQGHDEVVRALSHIAHSEDRRGDNHHHDDAPAAHQIHDYADEPPF